MLVRQGLRSLLERLPEMKVVGEASDGREALQLVRAFNPDVVLMAITLPELNGLQATARVRAEAPRTRVLIVSRYTNQDYVRQALRCGATGYLPKKATSSELERAIKVVAGGDTYISPLVLRQGPKNGASTSLEEDLLERLTPRQRETLELIAEGCSTKAIAQVLQISPKTVETHRAQLMKRLNIHDIPSLVRCAIRMGLVRLDT